MFRPEQDFDDFMKLSLLAQNLLIVRILFFPGVIDLLMTLFPDYGLELFGVIPLIFI